MRLRKKITISVASALLILTLLPTASAHPGGTDENGGHYDHSAGEYHYHHGYSAHQHYNGECPFDFDDATEPHGNKYTYNPSRTHSPTRPPATPTPTAPPTIVAYDKNSYDGNAGSNQLIPIPTLIILATITSLLSAYAIYIALHVQRMTEEISDSFLIQIERHSMDIAYTDPLHAINTVTIKQYRNKTVLEYPTQMTSLIQSRFSKELNYAIWSYANQIKPHGTRIDYLARPITINAPKETDPYFVPYTPHTKVYHTRSCRYSKSSSFTHLYDAMYHLRQCMVCLPDHNMSDNYKCYVVLRYLKHIPVGKEIML